MRKKQLPALERLKIKLAALGYDWFNPNYVQRLRGKTRNAEWGQKILREAPIEDAVNQRFCSDWTVAQLAKDGVEIEVKRMDGYLRIRVKKAKATPCKDS